MLSPCVSGSLSSSAALRHVSISISPIIMDFHHNRFNFPYVILYSARAISLLCTDLLRLSSCGNIVVPRTRRQIGDRAFSVAAPRTCNRLPTELKLLRSYAPWKFIDLGLRNDVDVILFSVQNISEIISGRVSISVFACIHTTAPPPRLKNSRRPPPRKILTTPMFSFNKINLSGLIRVIKR